MGLKDFLRELVNRDGSDLFFRAGGPARMKIGGRVVALGEDSLTVEQVKGMVAEMTSERQRSLFEQHLDIDFALYETGLARRFRVNVFTQRNSPAIVIRNIRNHIGSFEELNLPGETLRKLCSQMRGLILLTGSMGSGKSTTIASMLEYINFNYQKHILTVEEPIEFTFQDKLSLINQREIGLDVFSYPEALRAFALQSPDVIYIGNIRDLETMQAALTAAETGVLVFSTLHTVNAHQTIERIVNFFSPYQHEEVRFELANLLKGTISLRLIPRKDGKGMVPAYEIMTASPSVSRLIRENKISEILKYIEEGGIYGMKSFKHSLLDLVQSGVISEESAMTYADNPEELALAVRGIKR